VPKKKPAKRPSYIHRTDRRLMNVSLTAEQREKIQAAAVADARPMSQILVLGGLQYAEKILGENPKK
jgi:DNA-binding MarR family transcriptional regulator